MDSMLQSNMYNKFQKSNCLSDTLSQPNYCTDFNEIRHGDILFLDSKTLFAALINKHTKGATGKS